MKTRNGVLKLSLAALLLSTTFVESAEASFFRRFFNRFRKPLPNIAELVIDQNEKNGEFSTLLSAVLSVTASQDPNQPTLLDALSNEDLTVFAPTDQAFADIGFDPVSIADAPTDVVADILLYHVTAGKRRAFSLIREGDVEMLNGDFTEVDFSFRPFGVFVNDSKVIRANLRAKNGFVHVIDEVLLPPEDPEPVAAVAPLSLNIVSIPEPSSLALCLASVGLIVLRRPRESC